jgi:signal transduction histidine kinase/ActR/RegA family two-component response regulator
MLVYTAHRLPLLPLVLPIALAATLGGAPPAMLMTFLGGLLLSTNFLGLSRGQFESVEIGRVTNFLLVGSIMSVFGGLRNKARDELAKKNANLEKRKDDFLAMLGHELRNPLSGISSAARVLLHPGLDKRGLTESATIIQRQTAQMEHLINDLLDVSRVTRGDVTIDKAPVDLVAKIQVAVEQVSALVTHREHKLVLNLPASPVWVLGDKIRLVQVVTNLLVNAARYTPHKGELTVTLSTTQDEAHISVQDNGIGIKPELAAIVFDIFVQAKRSTDGVMGGLGLGLSLVKSITEAHGGRVAVYSAGLNHGSTFGVTLPLSADAQAQAQAQAQVVTETKQLDILLVDDNRDAAQPLAKFLEFEGHRVVVAHSGLEALKQAEQQRFDVALLDIGLPDMDGYTLARKFKEIPQQSAARLVAVTGYGTAQDVAKAYGAGFDRHIVKPLDMDLLLRELEEIVQGGAPALQASSLGSTS